MNYKNYLEEQGYSTASVAHYLWRLDNYNTWQKEQGIIKNRINYNTFLKYVKYLQSKHWKPQSVNVQILAVKYYFDYLIEENHIDYNPAHDVKVRREKTKVLKDLLSSDELEDLYYSFETQNIHDFYFTATAKRNKVITGLIVYQGLNSSSLAKLEIEHLQLYKGKIYVPSSSKSSSRTLELKPWQVIELLEYINEYRPLLQKHINNYEESLFPLNSNQFNNILNAVIKKLRQTNARVKNVSQLRGSRISLWLKKHNIREVQVMAGHKYIGSTEKYQQEDLESLVKAVHSFHPIS